MPMFCAAALAAVMCAAPQGDEIPAPGIAPEGWRFERGWPLWPGAAKPGPGLAARVFLADTGPFPASESDVTIAARATAYGGHEVEYAGALGVLIDRYVPFPELGPHAWRRSLHYRNASNETQDLARADMRLQPDTATDAPAWRQPFFRMTDTATGRSLCAAFWSHGDTYHFDADGDTWVTVVNCAWRLAPGAEAAVGAQSLWLGRPGPEGFRAEARRWYRAQGFEKPLEYPEWLRRGILYEASAGGGVESRFSNVGGFEPFSRQADYLADLGVSVMWLNGVHGHKTPPNPVEGGWNLYDPRDFAVIDAILGGPDGLRTLMRRLESAGIRVLGEAVPHGGNSVQARDLEAWWTRNRDGELARLWGGYGVDNASPEWQAVMRDFMAMLAVDYGIVGARIDVADGQGANWASPRTPHASYSTLGGGIEMLEAIRDGIARGPATQPLLIPESPLRPEYFAVKNAAVLGYGFESSRVFTALRHGDMTDAPRMSGMLRDYFEDERGALPPGALVIRTLNNHDTVVDEGSVQLRFGAGLARALYGVCLSVPGVPMLYQEEEVGSFHALRAMNWARRRIPEFASGRAVFPPVAWFAPEVFSVHWDDLTRHALCLVNLSGKRIRGETPLPEGVEAKDGTALHDAVSGRSARVRDGRFAWELAPYETALLRIGNPPEGDIPPPRFAGEDPARPVESADFQVDLREAGVTVRAGGLVGELVLPDAPWRRGESNGATVLESDLGRVEIGVGSQDVTVRCEFRPESSQSPPVWRVYNADAWQVSCRTALLGDRFLRRHFPFPADSGYEWKRTHTWGRAPWSSLYNQVLPSGRVWQSVLEPLHPDRPALAFEDRNGRGFVLDAIDTDAANMVLTDAADEDPHGDFRLETRFLAVDPDLHPRLRVFGPNQPWDREGIEAPENRALRVSFEVRPLERPAAEHLAAERLPVERRGYVLEFDGEEFREFFDAIFMPRPGAVVWRELAPVARRHRLELELRHSEQGPDAVELASKYTVEVNGVEQPLEWVKTNTASTGNAYFGRAQTPPLDLSAAPPTLRVTTLAPWCAVRRTLRLIPAE